MTKEDDTPVEEEAEETPPEPKDETNKDAPKEGKKYDGGAIPK